MTYTMTNITGAFDWNALKPLLNLHSVWLVPDIDDTLLTPVQYTCGTQWYIANLHASKGIYTAKEVVEQFRTCMQKTLYQPVDPGLNALVLEYLPTGRVIGLTHRLPDFTQQTLRHLEEVGLSFMEAPEAVLMKDGEDVFDKGIIYVGVDPLTYKTRHKGAFLQDYIESLPEAERPSHVIMVDDGQHNLKAVGEHMEAIGIGFDGYWLQTVLSGQSMFPVGHKICLAKHQYDAVLANQPIPSDLELHCNRQCVLEDVYPQDSCRVIHTEL